MTQYPQLLVSPAVTEVGLVTFRLSAPDAVSVVVRNTSGGYADWPGGNEVPMVRDEAGLWSATIGLLSPEYYTYVYVVDGVPALDPANPLAMRGGTTYGSSLRVPGDATTLYDVNDVPHGSVSHVWYPSPSLGLNRRMVVYTPPGYEHSTDRYPVLYLLHGGGGDEEEWMILGRAPEILDNLIARGQALPMIVVMANGHGQESASPAYVPDSRPRLFPGSHMVDFPESIVPDVIPFVDASYRTLADREHRAIAGLSMGGGQTLYCAFRNLDHFAWVAPFSGAYPVLPGVMRRIPAPPNAAELRGPGITEDIDRSKLLELLPDLTADANERLRMFHLAIGTEDGLITSHNALKELLDTHGVRYTHMELHGYAHEWRFWRIALAELAQRLFQ
jgi:enterochelin esterase family protein